MPNRLVELKVQLRDAPQLQPIADTAAEEAGCPLQGLRGLTPGRFVAERCVVDARDLQVRRDFDARQGDEPDSRVMHRAASQQLAQLLSDLVADAIWSMSGHYTGMATRSIEKTSMTSPTLTSL